MILFASLSACKDPVEEKCLRLCNQMAECTLGKFPDQRAASDIKISCLNGCVTFQSDVLACYAEGMTCEEAGKCLARSLMNQ